MKKLLLLLPLCLGCEKQKPKIEYPSSVTVDYVNGQVNCVEVQFMNHNIIIDTPEQIKLFKDNLQSIISDLNRAEEVLKTHEQKANSQQVQK